MYQLPIVAPGYGEETPQEEDLSRCLSNTCVIDKTVLTEALRGALNRPFFRILRIGEPLLIALCLGLLIWTLAARRGTGPAVLLGFVLVSVCLLYWLQFIRYPKKSVHDQLVKQAWRTGPWSWRTGCISPRRTWPTAGASGGTPSTWATTKSSGSSRLPGSSSSPPAATA